MHSNAYHLPSQSNAVAISNAVVQILTFLIFIMYQSTFLPWIRFSILTYELPLGKKNRIFFVFVFVFALSFILYCEGASCYNLGTYRYCFIITFRNVSPNNIYLEWMIESFLQYDCILGYCFFCGFQWRYRMYGPLCSLLLPLRRTICVSIDTKIIVGFVHWFPSRDDYADDNDYRLSS